MRAAAGNGHPKASPTARPASTGSISTAPDHLEVRAFGSQP